MSKLKFIFTILILSMCVGVISAQDDNSGEFNEPTNRAPQRPNLLRELDLTPVQIREIRSINQSNRQNLRAAQLRVAEARRSLDQAIYAESYDETIAKRRLKEFQSAQAEIAQIRAFTEIAIRKLLSPDQLVKFREMRERFDDARRARQEQRQSPLRNRNERRSRRNNFQRRQNQ